MLSLTFHGQLINAGGIMQFKSQQRTQKHMTESLMRSSLRAFAYKEVQRGKWYYYGEETWQVSMMYPH